MPRTLKAIAFSPQDIIKMGIHEVPRDCVEDNLDYLSAQISSRLKKIGYLPRSAEVDSSTVSVLMDAIIVRWRDDSFSEVIRMGRLQPEAFDIDRMRDLEEASGNSC